MENIVKWFHFTLMVSFLILFRFILRIPVLLILYFSVQPIFSKLPKDVSAPLSREVVLECDVKSYPSSVVRWSKLSDDSECLCFS